MKIAHGTLVLVTDGEKLLLFRNEGDKKYMVLQTLEAKQQPHTATHEQGSGSPGRSFASADERRSAYSETDWHEQQEARFAIHAARLLDEIAATHEGDIVVLAPPRSLGVLRKHWGPEPRKRIVAEIAKDLTHHTTDDVEAAIAAE